MYVELKHINKSYGAYHASRDINLGIKQGKLTALLGPSGSGKTTILRMLAGLEMPDSGDIFIDGKRVNDIPASKRGIGFVFQNYALFRYMTVFDNIAFGLEVQKMAGKDIRRRVQELIELVGLKGMEKRYPNELSGGQRQRVAFARAIAPNPQLLLLDEPFAAVDTKVRAELRMWLRDMIHKVGITSVFVTHDQEEAVEVSDEIIVTNQGRIEQIGTPITIYKKPDTVFVASFIGESQRIFGFQKLRGFEHAAYEEAILRPEFVEAFKSDNDKFRDILAASEEGTITAIAFRGNCLRLTLEVKGLTLITNRSLERRPVELGEKMRIVVYRMYACEKDGVQLLENEYLTGKHIITL